MVKGVVRIGSDNSTLPGDPTATGTGFFITDDGYLITNYRVVKDATKFRLLTSAGLIDAKVVPHVMDFLVSVARSWFYYHRQPRQPRPLRRPQLTGAIQQVLAQCPPNYG